MQRLSAYSVFGQLSIQDTLSFRAEFWGKLLHTLVSFALGYYLWNALFLYKKTIANFNLEQMMLYLCGGLLVSGALQFNLIQFVGEMYRSGSLSIELARPVSFVISSLSRALGSSFASFCTRGLPLFGIGLLFLRVESFPLTSFIIFLFSLFLGVAINFLFELLLIQLIPATGDSHSLRQFWSLCRTILSGTLLPLSFFPDVLFHIFSFLPIHLIFYTPMSILISSRIPLSFFAEFLQTFGIPNTASILIEQATWILFLSTVIHFTWKRSSKNFVLQGG